MLIHKNHYFLGNIQKIATPNKSSPYLQIIEIKNTPLVPIIIINLYMPIHPEDTFLIAIILETIQATLNTQQHTHKNTTR
jgi:hypothetical protein